MDISSINVKNYKCFKEIFISDIKKINILISIKIKVHGECIVNEIIK